MKRIRSKLRSVIILDDNIPHPSFPDFLARPGRCTDADFQIAPKIHHTRLAIHCLRIMRSQLRQNMLELDATERYTPNKEIQDLQSRIDASISTDLVYAISYWGVHVLGADLSEELLTPLGEFVSSLLLVWVEVLSLLGRLEGAYTSLEQAISATVCSCHQLRVCNI